MDDKLIQPLNPVIAPTLTSGSTRHAFFTREGGVSKGLYGGLNTGLGSNDERADVHENRRRVAGYFGGEEVSIAGCHQIHSADVVIISDFENAHQRPKADALVTDQPNISLAIQTADCGPVLFADEKAGVIGAAHAGWKGATGGIMENTIAAMEKLGASRENIAAVLGPTISQANYEVGPEFAERLIALDEKNARFLIEAERTEHFMFDLPTFIITKLGESDVASAEWTGHCTYAEENRFFSYRRTTHRGEPDYGRQTSSIMLLEPNEA